MRAAPTRTSSATGVRMRDDVRCDCERERCKVSMRDVRCECERPEVECELRGASPVKRSNR